MSKKEINSLIDILTALYQEVHENNIMLRQIVKVINTYLARHHQENEDDFNRNVVANMVSNLIEDTKIKQL